MHPPAVCLPCMLPELAFLELTIVIDSEYMNNKVTTMYKTAHLSVIKKKLQPFLPNKQQMLDKIYLLQKVRHRAEHF